MNTIFAAAVVSLTAMTAPAFADSYGGGYGPSGYGATGGTSGGLLLDTTPGAHAVLGAVKGSKLLVEAEQIGVGCLDCTDRDGMANVIAIEEGAGIAYLEADQSGQQYDTIAQGQFGAYGGIIAPDGLIGFDANVAISGGGSMIGTADYVEGTQETAIVGFANGAVHQQRSLCPGGTCAQQDGTFDLHAAAGGSFMQQQQMMATSQGGNPLMLQNLNAATVTTSVAPLVAPQQ